MVAGNQRQGGGMMAPGQGFNPFGQVPPVQQPQVQQQQKPFTKNQFK
jgi:hypothetical protein